MGLETKMLKQRAVWWPVVSIDDVSGAETHGEPEEVKCRWEDVAEEFKDTSGTTKVSNAKVYVDRDMYQGGVLWLGELEDITDQDEPFNNERAFRIEKYNKLPNLGAKKFLRWCML